MSRIEPPNSFLYMSLNISLASRRSDPHTLPISAKRKEQCRAADNLTSSSF